MTQIYEEFFEVSQKNLQKTLPWLNFFLWEFSKNLSKQKCSKIFEKKFYIKLKWFTYLLSNLPKWSKRLLEIEFVVFCRSNIKNEIWALQYDPRKHLKYWMAMCTLTYQNFAQKFRWYAHFYWFSANFCKFQNLLEPSIFVVQKR